LKRVFLSNNIAAKFKFEQRVDTFKVIENSNIKLSKRGDYKLIKVTKESISTMELIDYLSQVFKIKANDIGYAGLKDKHALTTQYITIPKYVNIKKFQNSKRVKLEEIGYCKDRLKIGSLTSNSFEIVLEDIEDFNSLKKAFENIVSNGFANFFGYQRFGVLNDSVKKGQKIATIGKGSKNQNSKILLAAYQSKFFNEWLNRRLELSYNIQNEIKDNLLQSLSPTLLNKIKNSNSLFKLLPGDLGYYFYRGKKDFKIVNNINKYTNDFLSHKYHITGVLFGSRVRLSNFLAGDIERAYIDYSFNSLRGARRDAWIWARDTKIVYEKDKNIARLFFTLPPGSYATVLLEELQLKEFNR